MKYRQARLMTPSADYARAWPMGVSKNCHSEAVGRRICFLLAPKSRFLVTLGMTKFEFSESPDGKEERRSLIEDRLGPDASLMTFNDALDDGQTNPGA